MQASRAINASPRDSAPALKKALLTLLRARGVSVGYQRTARTLAWAIALGAMLIPASIRAQLAQGAGDDAITLRAGMVRFSILGEWQRWYEQYLPAAPGRKAGTIGALGDPFSFDSIGPAQLPLLGPIQSSVRSLAAMPDFNASVGTSVVHVRDNTLSTPLSFEAGITNRITIGVLVPFVHRDVVRRFPAQPRPGAKRRSASTRC